jgi:hypothetical protein
MKDDQDNEISKEDADQFDLLYPMLRSVYDEMKEFSKKKQDGTLNAVKVKMTNRLLTKIKALLANHPTVEFLDLLDDQILPTNSDAVLIIAHFKSAMEQYRQKHHKYIKGIGDRWLTPDQDESSTDDLF